MLSQYALHIHMIIECLALCDEGGYQLPHQFMTGAEGQAAVGDQIVGEFGGSGEVAPDHLPHVLCVELDRLHHSRHRHYSLLDQTQCMP